WARSFPCRWTGRAGRLPAGDPGSVPAVDVIHEDPAQGFHSAPVVVVETIRDGAVDIPDAQQRAVRAHQRHHDFGLRGGVAGDVPRELADVDSPVTDRFDD